MVTLVALFIIVALSAINFWMYKHNYALSFLTDKQKQQIVYEYNLLDKPLSDIIFYKIINKNDNNDNFNIINDFTSNNYIKHNYSKLNYNMYDNNIYNKYNNYIKKPQYHRGG